MTPRATIRLQLNSGFTLHDAASYIPYYASLGISHLYLSPITSARAGSSHGYDVIDYRYVDPELGGEAAFVMLAQRASDHGMGIVLDIVPNHMAAHPDNAWWRSVLQHGTDSPYAQWFDIRWQPAQPELLGKVLLPVLTTRYWEALCRGDIKLVKDDTSSLSCAVAVNDLVLPLAAGSFAGDEPRPLTARMMQCDPRTPSGRQALHAVLERQHYRLAWWHCASDQLNWRRFFEIHELVGMCVERTEVFEAVHELPLRLFKEGWIDGLRIDHVDGLAYPIAYCDRLHRALCDRVPLRPKEKQDLTPWLIIEKILAPYERLDARWKVDGDTGYAFMDTVNAVLHDPEGETPLTRYWHRVSQDVRSASDWRRDARTLMVHRHFNAERDVLLEVIVALAQNNVATRDWSRQVLGRALDQLLIAFPVYRTYITTSAASPHDSQVLDYARDEARQHLLAKRDMDAAAVLERVIDWLKKTGANPAQQPENSSNSVDIQVQPLQECVVRRFQQLTPPLAAKALEDTVFYRYGRLLSRNDVGSDPGVFCISLASFHDKNQRRGERAPRCMVATATHDHKRGEDVRARLAVISELPDAWQAVSTKCLTLITEYRKCSSADLGHAYMLLQVIVGSWPADLRSDDIPGLEIFTERILKWQKKALREAKQMTSWRYPDVDHEHKMAVLTRFLLGDSLHGKIREILYDFIRIIAPAGALNSFSSAVLRCTVPGIPDLYQGTELWDFSLVDPDNRKFVDMERRETLLGAHDFSNVSITNLLTRWQGGAVKQAIIARCLRLRAQHADVFSRGTYEPIEAKGVGCTHVCAFLRCFGGKHILVVVSRLGAQAIRESSTPELPHIPATFWQDTQLVLPISARRRTWLDTLSGHVHQPVDNALLLASVLKDLPVAVLFAPEPSSTPT